MEKMAAVKPAPIRKDWADDDDDVEPSTSTAIPPPQTVHNKDGTRTEITFRLNEKGQLVKTTRRIQTSKRRTVVNARVAARKKLPKFGRSAKDPPGPAPDTTSVGENIIFVPSANWKRDSKEDGGNDQDQDMKNKLRDKKVKCRICSAEHFTAKCPYRDTMAPIGDTSGPPDGAPPPLGEDPALSSGLGSGHGASAQANAGGAGSKKGSYVPPALRGGPGAGAGEKMGGSRYGERDDSTTLRVTNVSELAEENELRDMFERYGRVTRVFLAKDRDTGLAKGFAFVSFADRSDAVKACAKMDGFGFRHLILRVEFSKKTT